MDQKAWLLGLYVFLGKRLGLVGYWIFYRQIARIALIKRI